MAVQAIEELKPVYLIFGEEELLLDRAVHRLKDRVAEVADLDFNFDVFAGATADADDVVAAANTLPFASDRRLVIVRDVDKMRAADQAVLATYAQNPAPTACVVLTAAKIRKDSKLYKAVKALGGVAEYKAPDRREVPGWVTDLFAARGRTISRDGAEALVRAVGRNLRALQSEADKIITFAGERPKIDRSDVVQVAVKTAPTTVFDLFRAMGARDAWAALGTLDELLISGEEMLGIHAMTVRQIRTLIGARALLDRGVGSGSAHQELGLAPWQAKVAMEQARRFSAAELRDALRGLAEMERRLKSGDGDGRVLYEVWLIGVCGGD